jgi:hypothetical protein
MIEQTRKDAESLVGAGDLAAARAAAEAMLEQDRRQPGPHNVLGFIAYREGG